MTDIKILDKLKIYAFPTLVGITLFFMRGLLNNQDKMIASLEDVNKRLTAIETIVGINSSEIQRLRDKTSEIPHFNRLSNMAAILPKELKLTDK